MLLSLLNVNARNSPTEKTWNLISTLLFCFDQTWQRLLTAGVWCALGYRLTLRIKFTAAPVPSAARNRQPTHWRPGVYCVPHGYFQHTRIHTINKTLKSGRNCLEQKFGQVSFQPLQVTCVEFKWIGFYEMKVASSTQSVGKKCKNGRWQDTPAILNYRWWPFMFTSLIGEAAFKFIFTYKLLIHTPRKPLRHLTDPQHNRFIL